MLTQAMSCNNHMCLFKQVVDMRWGVRDEATDDHMTTELCMREIKNCQRLSMGPNFVVFLGQKYGYRPIPTYILSSELQMLRDELASGNTDVTLLDTWYRKDSNAVPPISVLQPISSILINFNNKVFLQSFSKVVLFRNYQRKGLGTARYLQQVV